jgi:hypothetical protein
MIKRLNPFNITEERASDMALADWSFNSHFWIEESIGYFVCSKCGARHTSIQPITKDYPLCMGNPRLKDLLF